MFIQKIKIIVPNEVNELDFYTNQHYVKFNLDEINRLNKKITIYRTFDFNCKDNNSFDLDLCHENCNWKTFHYSFNIPFEYYVSKLECEITFNTLNNEFEFTVNGDEWQKNISINI